LREHYLGMRTIGELFRRLVGGKRTLDSASVSEQDRCGTQRPAEASAKYEFSLVACARWEEDSIQEWVEYHKSIGFGHIYLYSNDDDPIPLFRAVAPYVHGKDPFVTFLHWPHAGQQVEIYFHFLRTFKQETAWYSLLDIDEFFVLKNVDNIAHFMRDYEAHVDCLYFNWVLFGNNGKVQREDGPTLTSYPRRAPGVDEHTKMLCRSASIDAAAVEQGYAWGRGAFHHFLDNYKLPGVRCRDVLLDSTEGYSANFWASAAPFVKREGFAEAVLKRGYIAHFQFRSEEDFIRRWRRGGFGQDQIWRDMSENGSHKHVLESRNRVYDTYLASYWHSYTANAMRVGMTRKETASLGENVALNKPSWQSSVYRPDRPEPAPRRTAGGGNNGVRTGTFGFHTNPEMRPWWIVDLLKTYRIAAIHIYNRGDDPGVIARANELDVLASADGANWNTLWSNLAHALFGLDGSPLIVTAPSYLDCRFLLLRLRGAGCLHLDEVEVYGSVVEQPKPVELPEAGPIVADG
jgi:Glycosyl transferase family 2/F5/8 type C domain